MTDGDKYHILHRSSTGKFVLTKHILKKFLSLSEKDSLLMVRNADGTVRICSFNPLQPVEQQGVTPEVHNPVTI